MSLSRGEVHSRWVLVPLLLACGCAGPMRAYTGEPRPAEEVAHIRPWSDWRLGGSLSTVILRIDGRSMDERASAEVLPGKHAVTAGLLWTAGFDRMRLMDPNELVFRAEAGHTYEVMAFAPKRMTGEDPEFGFWIEDKDTEQVVAGTRPGEPEQLSAGLE